MLVILRLALGWHFLYEGVWKLTHRDAFVAETEGFLSAARGPAAKFFYRMVPDIDGKERLEYNLVLVEVKEGKEKEVDGKPAKQPRLAKRWGEMTNAFVAYYEPTGRHKDETGDLYKQFATAAGKVCQRHVQGLEEFVKENGDKIKAHFESLDRFHQAVKNDPSADFMRQRRWDQMQELRKEAKGWIADLDAREKALKADLMDLLNKERKREVESVKKADANDRDLKAAAALKADLAHVKTEGKTQLGFELLTGKLPSSEAKETTKSKSAVGPKPSDTPRDLTAASADGKKARAAGRVTSVAPKAEKVSKVATKERAAKATPTEAADDKETTIDFSPLAVGHESAGPFRASSNPLKWTRIEQLSFLLTYALLAIGACLMLGLFTRLSALAGAAFMLFVVLSQPPYPGVYPPDLPQMGHALLVNKDFVEMIALLVIASTTLGRWTGLDFILHYCLVKPFCRCCCCCKAKSEGEKA